MSQKALVKRVVTRYTLPKRMPEYYLGKKGKRLPNEPHLERLMRMFTYKRPYSNGDGVGYKQFTADFILPVARGHEHWTDEVGNLWVDLRTSPHHRTLFTAHTDSVHRSEGRQHVAFDPVTGHITVLDGECLGADDASGVAMMLHMIENDVPAMYAFFVGEEVGGVGSRYAAEHHYELLSEFDRAVAFDRRDVYSVITHQAYGQCCSDEFASALADELCSDYLMFAPDDTGLYTDTAEFTGIIPECTNLSIGYMHEHSSSEFQNLYFFQRMADQVLTVAWDDLPVVRDPDTVDTWYDEDYEDYEYDEVTVVIDTVNDVQYEVYNAINDALWGHTDPLLLMVARAAALRDGLTVDEAMTHINDARLAQQLLDYAMEDLTSFGTYYTLLMIYDAVATRTYTH